MIPLPPWIRLAPYAVIAALAIGLLWYRGSAIDARAEQAKALAALNVAIEANRAQEETIQRITEANERTDKLLAAIAADVAAINDTTAETQASVTELERSNEDVRAYLSGVVPADLQRLLNRP